MLRPEFGPENKAGVGFKVGVPSVWVDGYLAHPVSRKYRVVSTLSASSAPRYTGHRRLVLDSVLTPCFSTPEEMQNAAYFEDRQIRSNGDSDAPVAKSTGKPFADILG